MNLFSKTESKTLSDRLPYYNFDRESQAIWLKDGSATLSLKVTPKDATNLTDEELESLRFGLTPVLSQLPEGSVFQAILLRERSTETSNEAYQRWQKSHVTQVDTNDLNDARIRLLQSRETLLQKKFEKGEVFQTRCYVTLRVLPDAHIKTGKTLGTFSHFAFSSFSKRKTAYRPRKEIIRDLESALESLRIGLESIGFEVQAVSHSERLKVIYKWLNPERAKTIADPIDIGKQSISERVALTDLVETRTGLSLGRTEAKIASLKSLPEISIPAALDGIAQAQLPFSLVLTVYVLPQTQERERLLRRQRLAQGMASGNTVRNLMAEAQLTDVESTLTALISSGEKLLAASMQMIGLSEGRA